jgi:hypothetical protein
MPSTLPGFVSGGSFLVSGNPWSGTIAPVGGVNLKLGFDASGPVYVGVLLGLSSGGITATSGGALSSGGLSDGYELRPGDSYPIPTLRCSGQVQKIAVVVPAATSGRCRLFYDVV